MEKQKNNKGVIALLVVIIVILAALCVLFATGTISLNSKKTKQNTLTNQSNNNISSNPTDYISIEKVNIGNETINVEKVIFKNLDTTLTQKFTEEQAELIESAKSTYDYFNEIFKNENISGYYIEGTSYLAKSSIWYQINKNILTIYYELKSSGEMGVGTSIAVTNIDLSSKKVLTNEEILKLGNSSFNDIATKEYNRVLEECTKQTERDYCYYDKSEKKVNLEQHKSNKETFIRNIETKLDDLIKAYILDGKVKYDYNIEIRLVNEFIAMGGPFPYKTAEIGEYK